MIEETFNLLCEISEVELIQKKTLSAKIREITKDATEPPKRFLEHLRLIESVSHNYRITEEGKNVVKLFEEDKILFAKKVFELVKERYQVAKYLDKFISSPSRHSFKREEFDRFVIQEWLLDFGYEKDDRIDRDNALAIAEFLELVTFDEERQEYIINRKFKPFFSYIEFLAIIRELANFRNEWATLDLCEKLQARHSEYMTNPPDIDFLLQRLIELQKENKGIVEFSPGWPTPPIPSAYAFIRFAREHIATLRAPSSWKELEQVRDTGP